MAIAVVPPPAKLALKFWDSHGQSGRARALAILKVKAYAYITIFFLMLYVLPAVTTSKLLSLGWIRPESYTDIYMGNLAPFEYLLKTLRVADTDFMLGCTNVLL